ncbi:hypothetical protein [Pseudothauera hydrothermalis]|uniref:hypothetical protein n=1 Tax=Pseudothauera hydrothermalis TaxID=2184083 RepID=UPI000E08F042|nr:hypothetical protein [Pseudothauera hydrothermalis]
MHALCDPNTGLILAISSDPAAVGEALVRVPLPGEFDERDIDEWRYVDGALVRDAAAALAALKARRIAEIKRQAAAQIAALAWRVERAEERDRLGLPGETVAEVLIEREAIRRASNRCEAEVDAALDAQAVQAVVFAVQAADRATPQRLTRLQFLSRFSDAEMQTILAAADASPALKAAMLKWQTAEGIVLDDPATVAGVQALEFAGLIAPGRAAEILNPHQGD